MIYELTQIVCQTKAEIYPDLSGRGDIKQRRVKPYGNEHHPVPQKPQRGDITKQCNLCRCYVIP